MTGLLLRLAGPMQSWGDHSTFSVRDTAKVPTRSAMIGIIAAAQGFPRGKSLDDFAALRFTVRVDRPGTIMYDFHTVGGGLPTDRTVPTAEGKRRQAGAGTIVSRRFYLADAVFVVAVTGPEALIDEVHAGLSRPVWAPYLGRRSCPVEHPFLLCGPISDAAHHLDHLPLNRRRPVSNEDTVTVDFVTEEPSDDGAASRLTLNDVPVDLHPHRRRYRTRQVHITTRTLPADLCAGIGVGYLTALDEHLQGVRT
ncbi:type I-E CRISPR-associated protein Cas5/CasD [Micromonospora sp. NPDC048871]|uniref:type I-E CRISPR-associated protein Cas5/CasD n=1 Tax=unclassified Micromonospora TaxID=2617518 RepID=UPI002E118CFF|nr:type I-E CRISPR-associated protein Cas5/CasD [Micromonospora sp. NBC_01739]